MFLALAGELLLHVLKDKNVQTHAKNVARAAGVALVRHIVEQRAIKQRSVRPH